MPELPDIDVYVDALNGKLRDKTLEHIRFGNPFLLRSVEPPPSRAEGSAVADVRRVGKRIAIGLRNGIWLVIHLMIAGRLQWTDARPALGSKHRLAAFDFEHGSLHVTEAGTKKRASLYVVDGEIGLREHDPGGIEPLACNFDEFRDVLSRENHTLKRALTDPRLISGIGNAYSDEILHTARLSPVALTQKLSGDNYRILFRAMQMTLKDWREKLLAEAGGDIPTKVTAFRPEMSVHGRYGQPCPVCSNPVQRIRYKSNETNYCAACQTGSRILKDRALSKLLKADWPGTLDKL